MKTRGFAALAVALCGSAAGLAQGQVLAPEFAGSYTINDLGSPMGVPPLLGGLTFLAGDTNTLLIGGLANGPGGGLYRVPVTRDMDGHIVSLGEATLFAEAPYNDGGINYGPGGVLFASQWPVNMLSQYKPGSTVPDKVIDLAPFGVESSHSAINFVPAGYPGAGRVKLTSYIGGQWLDAGLAPDGFGTFDLVGLTEIPDSRLPGGPEGFAYVPFDSPVFGGTPTMILSEYAADEVSVYDMNANGDPIVGSRRTFISGLSGAEGALIDPVTGDFLFSTFGGGDRVLVVGGFNIPAPAAASLLGLAGLVAARRRR
ncbi:MAG: hypothetical protein ACKVS8_12025 [Phycisphaerales bacterium]